MMAESLSNGNPEDIFAKAIERVEAGETVEAVLTTAPEPLRAELREVLLLVSATHHLQRAPVPQPAAPRRAERKRAFLDAAAQMKAASALPTTPVVTPVSAPTPKAQPAQTKAPWWAALVDFWHDLQASFTAPNLRLAPLLTMIAVVFLAAFGFNRAASAADIGEPAYAVKQWMRDQKFNLSSEAQRPYVYMENVEGLLADINAISANQQNKEQTTPPIPRQTTQRLVFDGIVGDYLVSGKLRILMRYQRDLSAKVYTNTDIPVMPGVGQFIDVTFQVVPSNDGPSILQGIAVIVPNIQPEMDPTPTSTPTSTATSLPTATPCQPYLPTGWLRYTVVAGDTLSAIAARTGTTIVQLQQVNCLPNADLLTENKVISAPKMPPTSTPTESLPTLAVTLTSISTAALTPTVSMTPDATVVPTTTTPIPVTPPVITATVAPTATTVITAPVSQTPTAIQTPTPPMSVTLTVTNEPTTDSTLTATPVAPTAPVTGTITPETSTPPALTMTTTAPPAVTTTATTPPSGTTTATATTDAIPSPTATVAETTPTVAVTPTPLVVDTPTLEPLPTATTDPNQGGAGGGSGSGDSSGGEEPPLTNTPVPQSKSPLTGG